jgi:hypothetical protein
MVPVFARLDANTSERQRQADRDRDRDRVRDRDRETAGRGQQIRNPGSPVSAMHGTGFRSIRRQDVSCCPPHAMHAKNTMRVPNRKTNRKNNVENQSTVVYNPACKKYYYRDIQMYIIVKCVTGNPDVVQVGHSTGDPRPTHNIINNI